MRLAYREIELADQGWMDALFTLGGRGSLEYCFVTSYLWRLAFSFRVARVQDRLILMSDTQNPTWLFPSGGGPLEPAVDAMIADAAQRGKPLILSAVLEHDREALERAYPGRFRFEDARNDADYLYETESLTTLRGRKLSKKRNHIHQFESLYPDWQYEPLTAQTLCEARQLNEQWYLQAECEMKGDLLDEARAIDQAFEHFGALGLSGGLLRVNGQAAAFTMGNPLSEDTYLIHFEKALYAIQGAYTMINQQFATHACQGYAFINREEDAGDPGLRQAKMSYQPARLVTKYTATYVGDAEAV